MSRDTTMWIENSVCICARKHRLIIKETFLHTSYLYKEQVNWMSSLATQSTNMFVVINKLCYCRNWIFFFCQISKHLTFTLRNVKQELTTWKKSLEQLFLLLVIRNQKNRFKKYKVLVIFMGRKPVSIIRIYCFMH